MPSDLKRLERFRRSLELALNHEMPVLAETRRQVSRLTTHPIPPPPDRLLPAMAVVATDGGEGRLRLDPIRMTAIRVADSTGTLYFEECIPLSLEPDEILRFFFQSERRFQRLLDYLRIEPSELVPATEWQRSNFLAMLRELLEWAGILKLASQPPPRLILRDGLLRSVLLNERLFQRIRERLETLTKRHGHLLAGVAKRSSILSYLSLALDMNNAFDAGTPAWAEIPPSLEREAAPPSYRWVQGRNMGRLHLARLDAGNHIPLLPVDLAFWQMERREETLAILRESARGSFPLRGYPMVLFEAHQKACFTPLDIHWLEQNTLEELARRDPQAGKKAALQRLWGRNFVEWTED